MTDENPEPAADDPDSGELTSDAPASEASEVATAPAGPGRRFRVVSGVLALLVLVLGVLLVLTFRDRGDIRERVDRTDDIADVASRFGQALYSFDHRDVEGQLARLEEVSTPAYSQKYRGDFEANLKAQIVERQVVSTAEVHEVFVNQSAGDFAQAIVISATTVERESGVSGQIRTLIQLSMVRVNGEWLVDDVLTVANQGGITDAEGNPITLPTDVDGDGAPDTSEPPPEGSGVPSVPDDTQQDPAEEGE